MHSSSPTPRSDPGRRRLAALAVGVVLLLASVLAAPGARAQEASAGAHEIQGTVVLDDLEAAQRRRVRDLWSQVVCACRSENWSRALINCPDGCADAQKQEIIRQVLDGWDDREVLDHQRSTYGPQAIGKPDDVLTYLLPVLVLVASAVVVGFVYSRWRRDAARRREQRPDVRPASDELRAVERELEELR